MIQFSNRPNYPTRFILILVLLFTLIGSIGQRSASAQREKVSPNEWTSYGRDPGGERFSPLSQINRENVKISRWHGPIAPAMLLQKEKRVRQVHFR